jgi:hypothetical protein
MLLRPVIVGCASPPSPALASCARDPCRDADDSRDDAGGAACGAHWHALALVPVPLEQTQRLTRERRLRQCKSP